MRKTDKPIDWNQSQEKKTTKKPKAERAQGTPPETDKNRFIGGYFKPLGWGNDDSNMLYYFYIRSTMSIVKFKATSLQKQNLLTLAPLDFWLASFPNRDASNFDSNTASDFLINFCNALGYYNTENIRGRGAWQEKTGVIFHTGNQLISDNQRHGLGSIDTNYTYEHRKALNIPVEHPLSVQESAQLTKLVSQLNWNTKADALLLCGFLAIAPICGVLKWRPHLWITGPRGNGKSWVLENIVQEIIGTMAVSVQGTAATEPAVRQKLNSDALPVTIDEGEGNDERAAQRMQEIIALARAASSEKSPAIAKGGKDGKAVDYFVRSCFLFVSINPQLVNDSDKRRFCVLELKKLSDPTKFVEVEKQAKNTFFEDYGSRFQARMISIASEVQKSIKIFTAAVSKLTEDRAVGDQFGALLGGWWHTWNDKAVTVETAEEEAAIILDWRGVQDDSEDLTDEQRCLQQILSQEIRVESENYIGTKTVGELVEYAKNYQPVNQGRPSQSDANDKLMRLGLRVIDDNLLILNTSVWVKKILFSTPWANSWNTVLLRLKGASKRGNTRFAAGMAGRCVCINLKNY
jgi:putative DNA primase/helicase